MEKIPLYQVDAFTDHLFGGNPACVVPLETWLSDELLLKIASENAVSETAFFIANAKGFHIRWFTSEFEMDLCGHATLATAHVLKTILNYPADTILFSSKSGSLEVIIYEDNYTLNFPSRKPIAANLPDIIKQAINKQPIEVLKSRDYILVYEKEEDITAIKVNKQIIDRINIDPGGVIVTAKGNSVDFVSRFFVSQAMILEDPVTGSAHCSLIPYWSERLKKKDMVALQLSARVGTLHCVDMKDRVLITGKAKTYFIGHLYLH